MENAVTESDRLSRIDENVCILHGNTQNIFWVFDEKYETLSIYIFTQPQKVPKKDLSAELKSMLVMSVNFP